MCGIVGYFTRGTAGDPLEENLRSAVEKLVDRGPDHRAVHVDAPVGLGHTRLAIIDTSDAGNQPMSDESGRYTIVYNGEIYNHRELRRRLEDAGTRFFSTSDSEVVLKLFAAEGPAALERLNGFFSFAVYDAREKRLVLARDRMGIKPLYYCDRGDLFVFGSDMRAIVSFPLNPRLDEVSLFQYLQFSYIPAPDTIFCGVKKLEPGCLLEVSEGGTELRRYYEIPRETQTDDTAQSYTEAKRRLRALLDDAVRRRLESDVPLGCFLSGGVDSTVVASIASRHAPGIKTFSIGFEGKSFYDESADAQAAARFLGTDHTVFRLRERDLYNSLFDALDHIDEPFADSSALAVFVLSRRTRERVKVALSGDGADELFGGYNKHYAEYRARRGGPVARMARAFGPLWNALPAARDSYLSNRIRQLRRFSRGAGMDARTRYLEWCRFTTEAGAAGVLRWARKQRGGNDWVEYEKRLARLAGHFTGGGDLNEVLYADAGLVLPDDMLRKVDSMSMANGLEVRVPFLDHRVVELSFGMPARFKIHRGARKRILRDTFAALLPPRTLEKPKHGFEVPLTGWFRGDLRPLISEDLLADDFVDEQGIFDTGAIRDLRARLFGRRPGDVTPLVWALIVFQYWWYRYAS